MSPDSGSKPAKRSSGARGILLHAAMVGALSGATPARALAGESPPPIAIEAIAQIPFISAPVLSPDGKRILAKINAAGTERLAIYDLSAGPQAPPKFVPMGDLSVRWFSW